MGRDLAGFFRSPERPSPASIPVTAGKKTAKTTQKAALGGMVTSGETARASGVG